MLSVYLCPKVSTLSGFHCRSIVIYLRFAEGKNQLPIFFCHCRNAFPKFPQLLFVYQCIRPGKKCNWSSTNDFFFKLKSRKHTKDAGLVQSKWIQQFDIFGLTNRIHKSNLLKKGLQIESAIQMLKVWTRKSEPSGFVRIRICKSVFLRICFVL